MNSYCSFRNNQENQYFEYTLTIYNVVFEDEVDLVITAKSSELETTKTIKLNVTGKIYQIMLNCF